MDVYAPGIDLSPAELRPGMIIVEQRKHGKITAYSKVSSVAYCPGGTRGVGKTHVNEKCCYDNAATLEVVV